MKIVLANVALLSGIIGFTGYLFLILASAFGCCTGLTTLAFHKLVMAILAVAVIVFAICMYNNCCKVKRKS
jgi:hypothetical protein